MAALAEADKDIAKAFALVGEPAPRVRPAGFPTFLSTIVSQQVSTHAARAILGRVHDLLPEITAEHLLVIEDDSLREAGMSYRKIEYAKGVAQAIVDGRFDVAALKQLSDDEVVAEITALRGFGRWSAEIYLMFSLKRKDVFPADDLALLVALGRLKGLEERPTPAQARKMVEHWAPWRTVGALFLWHYYSGAPQ